MKRALIAGLLVSVGVTSCTTVPPRVAPTSSPSPTFPTVSNIRRTTVIRGRAAGFGDFSLIASMKGGRVCPRFEYSSGGSSSGCFPPHLLQGVEVLGKLRYTGSGLVAWGTVTRAVREVRIPLRAGPVSIRTVRARGFPVRFFAASIPRIDYPVEFEAIDSTGRIIARVPPGVGGVRVPEGL